MLILAVAVVGQALTPASYFTPADMERMRGIFAGARPYGSDLESVYYSILGFSLLDDTIPAAKVGLLPESTRSKILNFNPMLTVFKQ